MRIFTYSIEVLISTLFFINASAQTIISDGFESWTDPNHPSLWFGSKSTIAANAVNQYTTSVHGGTYAVQLIDSTTTHKRFTSQPVSVVAGTTYTITFWVRGHGNIRTNLWDGAYGTYNAYIAVNSSSWTQQSQTITAASSSSVAEFIFSVQSTVADLGHIQLDDVTITGPAGVSPVLTITSPSYNQVIYSSNTNVNFTVANFVVANGTGDGHVNYTVDGGASTSVYDTNPIAISGLTSGNHMIVVELVDNSNASLNPVVKDSVNIIVNLSTPIAKTIYEIQYTTANPANSPYMDSLVTTSGIVTGVCGTGFFIQDGTGPWNGIFILNSTYTVALGDNITVTGLVYEYFNLTEIKSLANLTINSSGNAEPAPATVNSTTVKDEQYEGVLVKINSAKCINTNSGFGMWTVSDGTNPGDTCKIHNLLYTITPTLNTIYDITGPVYYSFSESRIEPRGPADVTITGINANSLYEANIYPNPANNYINIFAEEHLSNIKIVDMLGNVVLEQSKINSNSIDLNIENLSNGIYSVVANSNNGKIYKTKFVKQ